MSGARHNRPYLEPLLDSDTPLGPMGRLLLAAALAARHPDEYGLATDALIAAIDDGRLDGRRLGEAQRALLAGAPVKPTRWVRTLGDAEAVSPLNARVIARALQLALTVDRGVFIHRSSNPSSNFPGTVMGLLGPAPDW